MKITIKGLLLCLLLSPMLSMAQDFNNYQPLQLTGELPKDVTTKSSIKYKTAIRNIEQSSTTKEKKLQEQFHLETNFGVDELLKSGKVLFNDPVGAYVTRVADELLKDDLELQKKRNLVSFLSKKKNWNPGHFLFRVKKK